MYSFVELLRAMAAIFITNSHFDGVYFWNISCSGAGHRITSQVIIVGKGMSK